MTFKSKVPYRARYFHLNEEKGHFLSLWSLVNWHLKWHYGYMFIKKYLSRKSFYQVHFDIRRLSHNTLGPVVKWCFLQVLFLPIFICTINEKYNIEAIYSKFIYPFITGIWHNVLWLFKVWQVHGVQEDKRIFMELLGCLACLYSWVGEPRTLQAACPLHVSTCHLSSSMLTVMALVPQWGFPTPLNTRDKQSQ